MRWLPPIFREGALRAFLFPDSGASADDVPSNDCVEADGAENEAAAAPRPRFSDAGVAVMLGALVSSSILPKPEI